MGRSVVAYALLVVFAVILAFVRQSTPENVLYRFPEKYRGEWFLLADGRLKGKAATDRIELRFNRHGICRVSEETFEAMTDAWQSSTCQVGGETVDISDRGDFVAGKVSCDLGGYEAGDDPTMIKAAPPFISGFIGDLEALKAFGNDSRWPRERFQDALLAERKDLSERSSPSYETESEGSR